MRTSVRRVVMAIAATAAALLLLIGLKGTRHAQPASGDLSSGENPGPGPGIAPGPVALPAGSYTVTGAAEDTPFGPVQVQIKVVDAHITDVAALQAPFRDGHSKEITQLATPMLRREALTAQSARIDVVSGATYTTDAYAQSLQSALDKASAGQHD